MVNGFRCERWKASALSTALTIYPCQIRVHQRWQSKLQLPTARQLGRRSGGRSQRAVHLMRLPVNTVIHTTLVGLEPATFRSLVDCWFDALPVVPPTHRMWCFFCENDVIVIWCTSTSIFMDYENFTHPTGDIRPLAPLCLYPCRADSRFTLIVAVSDLLLTE